MADKNTIRAGRIEGEQYDEPVAAATITPGVCVEQTPYNGERGVQTLSTAGAAPALIACEARNPPIASSDGFDGTNPVDETWEAGDAVETVNYRPGQQAYVRLASGADLATASNATITYDDELDFHSDGTMKAGASDAVAVPLEELDNSGAASGDNPLLHVWFV